MKLHTISITLLIYVLLGPYGNIGSEVLVQEKFMQGEKLFADLVSYAEKAPHMTGSKGDVATSRLLADRLKKAGLTVELQPWTLRQFLLRECSLEIDGRKVEAFPFWFPRPTGPNPLPAPLALCQRETDLEHLAGRIGFLAYRTVGPGIYGNGINRYAEKAAKAGAKGLIVVVGSYSGEIAAINARDPYHQKPLPIPCLIIPLKNEKAVLRAAIEGRNAYLEIKGEDKTGIQAINVIGSLKRGKKWVVVTTPISGWFACAVERGSGVALFLELARWAAKGDSKYSYLFLGNSGHELDNLGAHHTLDKYAPPVEDVACWIHLGASIAARNWARKKENSTRCPFLFPVSTWLGWKA
jgi:hypothetical protein